MSVFANGVYSQENKVEEYILIELSNPDKTYIIDGDTFAFVLLKDIDSSMKKMIKSEQDSSTIDKLKEEIDKRDLEIYKWRALYDMQLKRDSLQTKAFYVQRDKFVSLENDYKKLIRQNKLKFAIGGNTTLQYSNKDRTVSDLAISVTPGLLFNRRFLIYSNIGISLDQNLNFGIGTFTIF